MRLKSDSFAVARLVRIRFITPFGAAIVVLSSLIYFIKLKIWFVNSYIFLLIGTAFGYIAFLNWFAVRKDTYFLKRYLPTVSAYIFLATFAYVVLSGLNIFKIEFLQPFDTAIALAAFASGFFIFFANREKLNNLEQESLSEKQKEQERSVNFGSEFPNIKKVPVLRNLVRWCYVEGWFYSIGLVTLIIASIFVLDYRVGSHDLREDEFQMVDVATGYYYTGTFYKWDWLEQKSGQYTSCITSDTYCKYTRAWPHTLLVSLSYYFFGISEWSSRIVSVLFGVLFVPLVYFVTRFFSNSKKAALLMTSVTLINPAFVELFRYTRMYAILLPIFLLLTYVMYRALTETGKTSGIIPLVNKCFNFNYQMLLGGIVLLALNYFIHINSLILLPVLLVFTIYLACTDRENKYFVAAVVGIAGCLLFLLLAQLGYFTVINGFLTFFEKQNYLYYNLVSSYPFPTLAGSILLALGASLLLFLKKSGKRKWVYLCLITTLSLIFFIWIADRYAGFTYIAHIAAIVTITSIFPLVLLINLIPRSATFIIYLLLFISTPFGLLEKFNETYENKNAFGNYSAAYAVINENFNPQRDTLFGQYLKPYYLKNLLDKDVGTVSMLSNRQYTYDQFFLDISNHQSGWIAWETRKSNHLQKEIISYIEQHFKKYHGRGIDNTNMEVYFFDQTMKGMGQSDL